MTKEILLPSEQSYVEIAEMSDVESVMTSFASEACDIFMNEGDKRIVVPLNGSIIPLYYVLRDAAAANIEDFNSIASRLIFLHDAHENGVMTSRPIPRQGVFVLDDIADTLALAAKVHQTADSVHVLAPVQKRHSNEKLRETGLDRLTMTTIITTDNRWIACGAGMNEGVVDPDLNAQAFLSTLQRFAAKGWFKGEENSMGVNEKIEFFATQMLPEFTEESPLFRLSLQMEYAKSLGDTAGLLAMSQQVVPAIMHELGIPAELLSPVYQGDLEPNPQWSSPQSGKF